MNHKTKTLISIFSIVLMIGYVALFTEWIDESRNSPVTAAEAAVQTAEKFVGGTFEASGVARVAGTEGFLFVDDGKTGEVLWMRLDGNGKQAGSIIAVKTGANIPDPEGITTDGSYFYVVGSQSKSKGADQAGLARFRFNGETNSAEEVQTVSAVRRFLIENLKVLRSFESQKPKEDGINIEGLAWDPTRKLLLLGFRSPIVDGKALLVPLTMRDPIGPFSIDNLEAGKAEAILLPLGGMGIRSIEYDERQGLFHIIGGATKSQSKTDFKLWEWTGQADGSGLRETTTFNRNLQPEGVTSGWVGDNSFKLIVFDSSRYLKML